ncbi:MAG: hypothetical protein ACHQX1_02100 [Candidatus Micrarchaeales archaeon]
MYYSQFERIQRMEKLLERLAYFSVVLDFLVAVATFLVIRGVQSYSLMLTISNYLLTVEVGFTLIIFVSLVALKHYRKIIDRVAITTFRSKYPVPTYRKNGVSLLRRFLQIVLSPFVSTH